MAMTRSPRGRRGQSLVEFAVTLPVFVFLLFGLLDVGRLVYVNNAIAQAAREAARWGSVQGRSASVPSRATIQTYALNSMVAVPQPTVTVTCQDVTGAVLTECSSVDLLEVQVRSQVSLLTPVFAQLLGTQTYNATSVVAVNQ